MSKIEYLI